MIIFIALKKYVLQYIASWKVNFHKLIINIIIMENSEKRAIRNDTTHTYVAYY